MRQEHVRHLHVPQYEELSVEKIVAFLDQFPEMANYMPETAQEIRQLPRSWIINVGATIVGKPFRGLRVAEGVAEQLVAAQAQLRHRIWGEVCTLVKVWYQKLVRECESSDDDRVLDANTKHMCNIHAHLLLMMRNAPLSALTEPRVTTIVSKLARKYCMLVSEVCESTG